MATQTVPQEQLEWIFQEIVTRAKRVIYLDRHIDIGSDGDALFHADAEKLDHIAYMGWLADLALTRMGSVWQQHDGDPVAWMMCPSSAKALKR